MQKVLNYIFTAVVGRSGQTSLARIFNTYGIGCYAEVGSHDLPFKRTGSIGPRLNRLYRKWIFTHEMVGRGKALEWVEQENSKELDNLAYQKLKRIKRLQNKYKFDTYLEISKFFLRTFFDSIPRSVPEFGLIKLTRDPVLNARSYMNRNKDFFFDNVPPHYRQNCLRLDTEKLTKIQLYFWSWCEIELRYYRFIEKNSLSKVFELDTADLNQKQKLNEMFDCFGIRHHEIQDLTPQNTNIGAGNPSTVVTEQDIDQFQSFLAMIPKDLLNKILYLKNYDPFVHLKT